MTRNVGWLSNALFTHLMSCQRWGVFAGPVGLGVACAGQGQAGEGTPAHWKFYLGGIVINSYLENSPVSSRSSSLCIFAAV